MTKTNSYRGTIYACYFASITIAIGCSLSPLLFVIFQDSFALTMEKLGRLLVVNFATQICADMIAIKLVPIFGTRKLLIFAHSIFAVGMVCLSVLPQLIPGASYTALVIATVIYSYGAGTIEATSSAVLDALPGEAKAAQMSLLHSMFCWGQVGVILFVTFMIRLFGDGIWPVLPIFAAILPAVNAVAFTKVPFAPPLPEEEQQPLRSLMKHKIFLLALLMMMCAGASEIAMSQWASYFAEKGLGVTKVLGDLLGPCLFAVLMGIGRLLYGIFGHRFDLKKLLLISAVLCIISYLGVIFVSNPIISLLSCGLCGLAVSLMWPGTLSLSSARFPGGGTAMFALMAVFGDFGCSAGPWITGFVSDRSSINTGLLAAMVFPVVMLIGTGIFTGMKKK